LTGFVYFPPFRILDDEELYEKQKPFHCTDLVKLSCFLNVLVYKLTWNNVGRIHSKTEY